MTTFAIASLLLIMMPGPDQALITRNALVGGRAGGVFTMLGGALGTAVHATCAAVGLSALLLASTAAFTILKVVGVIYLIWMAMHMLRTHAQSAGCQDEAAHPSARTNFKYLRQGFLTNALNPKVALFFVTFLPQFIAAGAASPRAQALLFAAVFAIIFLAWFSLYIAAVERLGRWLRRPTVKARIENVTGVVLLGVAARLATASH